MGCSYPIPELIFLVCVLQQSHALSNVSNSSANATRIMNSSDNGSVDTMNSSESDENSNPPSSGGAPPMWLIGVFVSILGSIFSNMGQNIQKYAQNLEPDKEVSA